MPKTVAAVDCLADARSMAWPPLQTNDEAMLADVATVVEPLVDFTREAHRQAAAVAASEHAAEDQAFIDAFSLGDD